jgi:hypothetical protein
VKFEQSELQTVPPKPVAPQREESNWRSPPAGVIAVAITLLAVLVCVLLYWNYVRIRSRVRPTRR